MTLEDLRAFVAAYRAGSLSAAARELGCTQGAVAQHVRKLERELSGELFTRHRRGIRPTALGKMLYEGSGEALGAIDAAVVRIRQSVEGRATSLRLAISASIVTRYLRPAIRRLRELRPEAEIEIVNLDTAEARIDALREGRADLAAVPLVGRSMQSLEVRPLAKVPLGLMVHARHPLAERAELEPADLGSIRYIAQAPSSATCRHLEEELRRLGVALVPSSFVEDATAAALMVEVGDGETFCPLSAARSIERSGRIRVLPVKSLAPLRMVWVARDFSLLSEVAREFVRLSNRMAREVGAPRTRAESAAPR